jgi:hypothetical protein
MAGGERLLEGASINLPVLVADGRVLAFRPGFITCLTLVAP